MLCKDPTPRTQDAAPQEGECKRRKTTGSDRARDSSRILAPKPALAGRRLAPGVSLGNSSTDSLRARFSGRKNPSIAPSLFGPVPCSLFPIFPSTPHRRHSQPAENTPQKLSPSLPIISRLSAYHSMIDEQTTTAPGCQLLAAWLQAPGCLSSAANSADCAVFLLPRSIVPLLPRSLGPGPESLSPYLLLPHPPTCFVKL